MIDALIAHEACYTEARVGAIARRAGNPFGAEVWRRGEAFACRVRGVPSPWLNRATGLTPDDPEILRRWFGDAAWRAETWADRADAALAAALARAGKHPGGGDAVVIFRPQPRINTNIEDSDIEIFIDAHLAGLGIPDPVRPQARANMRGWEGLPGWHFLLARRKGEPAGTCVLHRHGGLAYIADMATLPAWRGQGVQTELLAECHRRAAGMSAVWARCRFASQSHRNLARAGLNTLCTTQFWI